MVSLAVRGALNQVGLSGHPLKRPAAMSRSLKRRSGATKPPLKAKKGRNRDHEDALSDLAVNAQQSCAKIRLEPPLGKNLAHAGPFGHPAEVGVDLGIGGSVDDAAVQPAGPDKQYPLTADTVG